MQKLLAVQDHGRLASLTLRFMREAQWE